VVLEDTVYINQPVSAKTKESANEQGRADFMLPYEYPFLKYCRAFDAIDPGATGRDNPAAKLNSRPYKSNYQAAIS
jgi:hypothetical protein